MIAAWLSGADTSSSRYGLKSFQRVWKQSAVQSPDDKLLVCCCFRTTEPSLFPGMYMHAQMRSSDTNACSDMPGFVPLPASFVSQVVISGDVVRNRSLLCFACAGCSVHTGRLEAFAWKASTCRLQDGTAPCGFSPVGVFDGFLRIFWPPSAPTPCQQAQCFHFYVPC